MLRVWSADKVQTLNRVIDSVLKSSGVEYEMEGVGDSLPFSALGDVVFAMGTKAYELLMELGLCPKNRTISSLRLPYTITLPNQVKLVLTYSSAMIDRDYEKYVCIVVDLNTAIRAVTTGSFAPKLGNYQYVDDFSEAIKWIEDRYANTGKPVEVVMDTETLGLDPINPKAWIISLQLTYKAGQSDMIYFSTQNAEIKALKPDSILNDQLIWLLKSETISMGGANFKFDQHWLWQRAHINCTNFKFDTMLVGSLLDENRGNSLNLHTKWYVPLLGGYDDYLNKKYDKGRMDLVPKDELLDYAGGDTDACYQVRQKMTQELKKDPQLARFYINIIQPASRAYEKVERHGLCLDIPYYLELENEIETEIAMLEKQAFRVIGGSICAKYGDDLKLSKAALLKDFMFGVSGLNLKPKMFTEKTKEPSTSVDHILMFANNPKAKQFLDIYKQWASASKTLSTYVCRRDDEGNVIKGFLSHMRADSRFHPTYFLFNGGEDSAGTNTGRVSARDPAIQTLPKHTAWAKKLRKAYIAPQGMMIMSNDYSQGELKIAACLSNEETMIAAYKQGIDLHAVTASRLAGYEWDDFLTLKNTNSELYDSIRQLGKAGNFGLIYGMGAAGFQAYAGLNYGVEMQLEQAQHNRDVFFETYPALLPWHIKYKNMAKNWGLVRSPLGRVRHLPLIKSYDNEMRSKAERQSVNAPVQATLSDFSLWATATMHDKGWFDEQPIVAMVHDQLISYVPEDYMKYAERTKEVMENLPIQSMGWTPQLKFTVDCEVGINLGSMKKVKM